MTDIQVSKKTINHSKSGLRTCPNNF